MAVTDTNTPASELLVEALRDVQPRAYLYQYTDPMSGKPVWRSKGEPWNGQTPKQTEALYSVEQIALAAQPRDDVRELLRDCRNSISFCSGSCDHSLITRIDTALATTTQTKMLMSQEWLDKKIATDPDDAECEAGPSGLASPLDQLLRYHETGGHEGDGSDETLSFARQELTDLRTDRKTILGEAARKVRQMISPGTVNRSRCIEAIRNLASGESV